MIESLLLAVTRVSTFLGNQPLTGATGFFFERDGRLFLATSRHVVLDEASHHRPDRLAIELHLDAINIGVVTQWSMPLYRGSQPLWREGVDSGGSVDVVALEIQRSALPESTLLAAFTPAHLVAQLDDIEVGAPVLIVGFPLGFHDQLASPAGGAPSGDRLGVRHSFSGPRLFSNRRHDAPRHERRTGSRPHDR